MKIIRSIAKPFAKNKVTWAMFIVIFSAVHGVFSVVLNHLHELRDGSKKTGTDREQLRQDVLVT
jgi:hypothetical protein